MKRNEQHTAFVAQAIESFSIGDEDSIKNRYTYKQWTIKPFVLNRKQLTTDDVKYNYIELDQKLKANGFIYLVRIFTEKKQHYVQTFVYRLGDYAQAKMIGEHVTVDSIFEARAICFNWYLSQIRKRQQIKEGFLIETDEEKQAKKTVFVALPWTMRWLLRRVALGFFCVVGFIELIKNEPLIAATLVGYTGLSLSILVLGAFGLAKLKQLFQTHDPDYFEGSHLDDAVEAETVTFKKAVK